MQASPPHGYLSPTHLSPNGLPGWLASTAAVTVPATATADMKPPTTDNRWHSSLLWTHCRLSAMIDISAEPIWPVRVADRFSTHRKNAVQWLSLLSLSRKSLREHKTHSAVHSRVVWWVLLNWVEIWASLLQYGLNADRLKQTERSQATSLRPPLRQIISTFMFMIRCWFNAYIYTVVQKRHLFYFSNNPSEPWPIQIIFTRNIP